MFSKFWTFLANFSKSMLSSTSDQSPFTLAPNIYSFSSPQARMIRYDINWSYYENNTYDNEHRWLYAYMKDCGLFTETDGYFNPVYRMVEFWATHLMGGAIDPDAGDGSVVETAIPIVDATDKVRQGIARLFADSKWEIEKPVWCRLGAALGDVACEVIDDVKRRQMRLRVIDPRTIPDIQFFSNGDVKSCMIQEWFADPRVDPETETATVASPVLYTEKIDIVGGRVRYRTYLGDEPYAWYDKQEWFLEQDFIPIVFHCHTR